MSSRECQSGWWQDIGALFKGGWFSKWRENKELCTTELWNQIATAYAVSFILAAFSAVITQQVLLSVTLPLLVTTIFLLPDFWLLSVKDDNKVNKSEESHPLYKSDGSTFNYNVKFVEPSFQDRLPDNPRDNLGNLFEQVSDEKKDRRYDSNYIGQSTGQKENFVCQKANILEGFVDSPPGAASGRQIGVLEPALTLPSARNPFMNVSPDEVKYNPFRPPAADVDSPSVKKYLDNFFRVQWFSDPTDVFGKSQDQRQFITQPSTSVPNDRESYQNWLYKLPFKTCKEGGRDICTPGSAGVFLPSLQINNY